SPCISLDSIVTTAIDVLPSIEYTYTAQICDGSAYLFNGQSVNIAGQYQAVLTAANGCDSIVTLNLETLGDLATSSNMTICAGTAFDFAGQSLTATGVYQGTFTAVGGCDSTSTVYLTVLESPSTQISTTLCPDEGFVFNGQTLTSPGVYQAVLTALNGCDSLVTLNLNYHEPIHAELSATICANENYSFNGQALNATGNYEAVLTAANGCDSTISLELMVLPVDTIIQELTICEGESVEFDGQNIGESGTYYATSTLGVCDSVMVLILDVTPQVNEHFSVEICEGDTYVFHGQVLTQTGDYVHTETSNIGCVNTTYLHLEVKPVFVGALQLEFEQGDSWNGIPIVADTLIEAHYTATNGCDSTVFVSINVLTGTNDLTANNHKLSIFPNPFDATTTIEIKGIESGNPLIFKLMDVTGRLVQQRAFRAPSLKFQRENLPSGLYFIKVESEDGRPIAVGRMVAK
ncbi:MAG: T9SS type A sorting domain-containing protein, partial [Saprospiraceae bacterium]|nr:T9SS type A sorting domain-containing protein [Saprospiraceae bacterium]